jgi:malate synthase
MSGCEIRGESPQGAESIITPEALDFIAALTRRFGAALAELLAARRVRQAEIDAGKLPDFLPGTRELRESDWIIAELPEDLQDRRVELLGAAELQTIVDALNSGARVFIADFEDRLSPTWHNVVSGQMWLREAVLGKLAYTATDGTRRTLDRHHATRWPCVRAAGISRRSTCWSMASPHPVRSSTSDSIFSTTRTT